MAGKVVVSTLNDDTGVLATQNGMTGIAKAWVNFNGVGGASISSSFNVSSVTYNATGDYTVNFTTAMPTANYSIAGSSQRNQAGYNMTIFTLYGGTSLVQTASNFRFYTCDQGNSRVEGISTNASVFSS
jgi:hypothetical protein